ncbi:hypothetical protein L596_028482 [Steinernema carpocapsae]|uniref:G-protein coupled receptors family 1 profile domain-containing protein n=1 Tax=Steinernema carpocapsae TaxID=34508 RepID=A0A4U5LYJ7_STECR|nr:hypothetical protein L596_028482 [Steinernema carpocapsae]
MGSRFSHPDFIYPPNAAKVSPLPIGITNVGIFAFICPLNLLILVAIFRDKSLWKLPAYQIIFHLTIANLFSTIATFELGMIAFFDRQIEFNSYVVAVGSLISYYGPNFICILSAIQALNRFVVINDIHRLTEAWIYKKYHVLITLTWLFILITAVSMISTGMVFSYMTNDYLYFYDFEEPVHTLLFYISMTSLGVGASLFLLAIISLVLKRGTTKKRDIQLLVQGIIPFAYLAIVRALMTFPIEKRPVELIILLSLSFRGFPVVFVVVYLGLNKTLRKAVRSVLLKKLVRSPRFIAHNKRSF